MAIKSGLIQTLSAYIETARQHRGIYLMRQGTIPSNLSTDTEATFENEIKCILLLQEECSLEYKLRLLSCFATIPTSSLVHSEREV